jgi:tRNA(His) 5'-end guanylyltransferase
MNPKDLEDGMRELEFFHSLRVPKDVWKIIRLDGRTFSKLTLSYKKPFDLVFRDRMLRTTRALVEQNSALYAHTHSDEISLLFPPDWTLFDNEVEKLVSSTAADATAEFNFGVDDRKLIGKFDSRIWFSPMASKVVDYFSWRQSDCTRCAINGSVYWHMRDEGWSQGKATREMERKNFSWKNEYLFSNGLNFNNYPRWQRRGVGFHWETFLKEAYNPVKKEKVWAQRRRVAQDLCLPDGDNYRKYVSCILQDGHPPVQRTGTVTPRPEMLTETALMV